MALVPGDSLGHQTPYLTYFLLVKNPASYTVSISETQTEHQSSLPSFSSHFHRPQPHTAHSLPLAQTHPSHQLPIQIHQTTSSPFFSNKEKKFTQNLTSTLPNFSKKFTHLSIANHLRSRETRIQRSKTGLTSPQIHLRPPDNYHIIGNKPYTLEKDYHIFSFID